MPQQVAERVARALLTHANKPSHKPQPRPDGRGITRRIIRSDPHQGIRQSFAGRNEISLSNSVWPAGGSSPGQRDTEGRDGLTTLLVTRSRTSTVLNRSTSVTRSPRIGLLIIGVAQPLLANFARHRGRWEFSAQFQYQRFQRVIGATAGQLWSALQPGAISSNR